MSRKPQPWYRQDRGIWVVQIDGKRFNLGRDKREALRRYHELMAQPQKRRVPSQSLIAIIDLFLDWCEKHRAAETYEWYRSRLQDFVQTIPPTLRVNELKPHHVTTWMDSHASWKTGSKRNACRSIKRAMKWALEEGLIEQNPIAHLKKRKGGKRELVISEEHFQNLLTHTTDSALQDLLVVTWETGCRPQESLRVKARHVDLANSRWVVPPGEGKPGESDVVRVVYLTELALAITKRLMLCHPEGKLFRNSAGSPWTADAVNCALARIRHRLGREVMRERGIELDPDQVDQFAATLRKEKTVKGQRVAKTKSELRQEARWKLRNRMALELTPKVSLYALRHSWATHALERGLDGLTVAILLGHQDPSTLARVYQHLSLNPRHLLEQARRATG